MWAVLVSPPQAKSSKIFAPFFQKAAASSIAGHRSLIQSTIIGPTRSMTTPVTKVPAM
jgi:hypothetical protein